MKKFLFTFIILFNLISPMSSFAGDTPFAVDYAPDEICWRGVIVSSAVSEYIARRDAHSRLQESYLKYLSSKNIGLPSLASHQPYIVETSRIAIYDKDNSPNLYHFWMAGVMPLPGYSADCIQSLPKVPVSTEDTVVTKNVTSGTSTAEGNTPSDGPGAGNSNSGGGTGSSSGGLLTPGGSVVGEYTPGPSGLAMDCNRGEPIRQLVVRPDGTESWEVVFPNDCGFEDLMGLINRIINFLLFVIATPIVAIGLAYAGWLYISSGGNSSNTSKAKSIMKNMILGYVVALCAWIIIKTIMTSLGFDGAGIFLDL
jgi:hypothetical protein